MFNSKPSPPTAAAHAGQAPVCYPASPDPVPMTEELLPFTLRVVRSQESLDKAVHIRHAAYARHLPEFAQTLKEPEPADFAPGVVLLLAESKLDGSALGTMRLQSNEFKPLALEHSIDLPDWLRTQRLAEATRLAVTADRLGRVVKTALFKSYFQHCQITGVDWMVIAGREPIDRMYDSLLFEDVFPGRGYIPLPHAGNLPHRLMSFHIASAQERWARANHPLFDFVFSTAHPDIKLGGPLKTPDRRQRVWGAPTLAGLLN